MFTSLTVGIAWFAFGYSITDLLIKVFKGSKNQHDDELYRNSGHHGTED